MKYGDGTKYGTQGNVYGQDTMTTTTVVTTPVYTTETASTVTYTREV